jgi:hypothetical protein
MYALQAKNLSSIMSTNNFFNVIYLNKQFIPSIYDDVISVRNTTYFQHYIQVNAPGGHYFNKAYFVGWIAGTFSAASVV